MLILEGSQGNQCRNSLPSFSDTLMWLSKVHTKVKSKDLGTYQCGSEKSVFQAREQDRGEWKVGKESEMKNIWNNHSLFPFIIHAAFNLGEYKALPMKRSHKDTLLSISLTGE